MHEIGDYNRTEEPDKKVDLIHPYEGGLIVKFTGVWKIGHPLPDFGDFERTIGNDSSIQKIAFDTDSLESWDSVFITYLLKVLAVSERAGIEVIKEGLPEGVVKLLALASAGRDRAGAAKVRRGTSFVAKTGESVLKLWRSILQMMEFLGEVFIAFLKLVRGKARFRWSDFLFIVQQSGAQALPIVSLISLLVGLILAFVGSIQLKMFGAQIYIADLVAIAMARAMGAIMTGIIMAGRTGASFAAGIGTMQVNEEVDALKTAGLPPIEFLVLPRVMALSLMMPLLTLYAVFMGIVGGLIVGVGGFDIGIREYLNETRGALTLTTIAIGLFSSFVFGILVALAGCLRGMQCGRSASAVGDATTSAVVTSIVSIIIATAIITVSCDILGI